jgi:alpha-galactosidase
MAFKYFENDRIFKMDTKSAAYIMAIVDKEGFLGHVYFGNKVAKHKLTYLMRIEESPFVPSKNNRDRVSFYDSFPSEYSSHAAGDFREAPAACELKRDHGTSGI